jgi:hypothetical protein
MLPGRVEENGTVDRNPRSKLEWISRRPRNPSAAYRALTRPVRPIRASSRCGILGG